MAVAGARAEEESEVANVHVLVTREVWRRLMNRKSPGMSMCDVITELLDDADEALAEDTR